MIIISGLSQKHKSNAVDLFFHAFGEKFIPILGKNGRAKRLLDISINETSCFSAVADTELLGVLAFQIREKNFFSFKIKSIIKTYGLFRGITKAFGLSMLYYKPAPYEIYIEAIAVSEYARGQGIGTKLLNALYQFARDEKYKTVSLQVIDTNPEAKKLYERLGFNVVKHVKIWPVNRLVGWSFKEVFLMKKEMNYD